MTKKPESRLQLRIRDAIESTFPGSWFFKVHGGPFQPSGIPDLVGCVSGRFVAIEVKLPGEGPSAVQVHTMRVMKEAGACVGVVHSVAEAVNLIRSEVFGGAGLH